MTIQQRGQQQIPGQLKMFMTPSEIHAEYQPLDADRMDPDEYGWGGGSYTASAGTMRSTNRGTPPTGASEGNVEHGQERWGHDTGGTYRASTYGTKYRARPAEMETDEQLWERKHEEAYDEWGDQALGTKATVWTGGSVHEHGGHTMPTADLSTRQRAERSFAREQYGTSAYQTESSPQVRVPGRPSMSLGESIEREGVLSPIRLGQTIGSMGKKEIVGGHHRLAVATALGSEQLLPVLHHTDIYEARSPRTTASWKYT